MFMLKEGDIDPSLGKKIAVLILSADKFIVYLDERFDVQWTAKLDTWPAFAGTVLNRVSRLEGMAEFLRSHPQFLSIKAMIGEGVARLLDADQLTDVSSVLDEAEKLIRLRNREYSRKWFFLSIFSPTVGAVILSLVVVFFRSDAVRFLGINGFEVVLSGLLGSLGALASVCLRNQKLTLDANAGFDLHVIEGVARVVVGMTAASLFVLMLNGGMILQLIPESEHRIYFLLAMGIILGASERALPAFIKRGEELVLDEEK